jgi:excisionase family DNA binding protein
MDTTELPATFTARELAEILKLHPETILRLARDGSIPSHRVGSSIRFTREDLEAALTRPMRVPDEAAK